MRKELSELFTTVLLITMGGLESGVGGNGLDLGFVGCVGAATTVFCEGIIERVTASAGDAAFDETGGRGRRRGGDVACCGCRLRFEWNLSNSWATDKGWIGSTVVGRLKEHSKGVEDSSKWSSGVVERGVGGRLIYQESTSLGND